MCYLDVLADEIEYVCMYGPPDRKEFLYDYEDPSYDADGVCIQELFDDVPY